MKLEELIKSQDHHVRIAQHKKYYAPDKFPVSLSGGVGDVILAIPLVEALYDQSPLEIYSNHPDTFNYFKPGHLPECKQYPVPDYKWFLQINSLCLFKFNDRLIHLPNFASHLQLKQYIQFIDNPELETFVLNHPLYDAAAARFARKYHLNRMTMPFFSLGLPVPGQCTFVRGLPPEKIITIHDGYELASSNTVKGKSTKQWDLDSWNILMKVIKSKYPGYKIIQLGGANSRPIDGAHENLINKTTLIKSFEIIKKSALHIDGDSGLTHAATSLGVPCVVLFGPTPDYFFGYKQNKNIRAKTCPDACYWMKTDWLNQCPIGTIGEDNQCMSDISPGRVFSAVESILSR